MQTVGPAATAQRYITRLISENGLGPGAQLPTEREIAAATGVSRAVVRTALQQLADNGVVVRQVGRGTFVAPDGRSGIGTLENPPSPASIMQARLVLEPEFLPTAVLSATQEDLDDMRRHHEASLKATTSPEFERLDTLLHHSFAIATHNPLIIEASRLLIDSRHQPIWGQLKRRSYTPELQQRYCIEHANIVEAIADRDPDAAREHMRLHLRHVSRVLLGPNG